MNTNFDSRLREIDHYKRYPAMIPFVGDHYESSEHGKVLLIAENNYLDEGEKVPLDVKAWYAKSQNDLTKKNIDWINCRMLVGGEWKEDGHKIYININEAIESVCFGTVGSGIRGMDHVAFMNAFQRPSCYQEAIKMYPIDKKVGFEVIKRVAEILKPDCVIFVLKKTFNKFHSSIKDQKLEWVYHPGDERTWYKKKPPYGKDKFIKIIKRLKN